MGDAAKPEPEMLDVTVQQHHPAATDQPPQEPAGPSGAAVPNDPIDLRLVALTPAGSHLVLEGSDRAQYRVAVDHRLATALRAPDRPRTRQLEIAVESQLSPREIQTRVRSGQTVEEVAAAAGIAAERIERYAVPVLAERAHVVELAHRAPARRATGGTAPALGEMVGRRLTELDVLPESVTWDAVRGEDDRWTVRLTYLAADRERVAAWAFDPRGRVLAPVDDEARWLVEGTGTDRESDDPPTAVRRLSAVPHADPGEGQPASSSAVDEVYDREADERRGASAVDHGVPAGASGPAVRGRRQPVPSWDDIMFGPRKRD